MPTHAQVAHNWAHKTGRSTNGHNMLVYGDTIYSYGSHFAIARHVTLPDGTAAVLFTTRSYSQSTAQHMSHVRRAVSHLRVILVRDPSMQPSVADVDDLLTQAQTAMDKARRARVHGDMHIGDAARLLDQANDLIAAFGLDRIPTSLATLSPNLAAIRERNEAARLEAERKRVAEQLQARLDWQSGLPGTRFYGSDEHGNAYCRVHGDHLQTSLGASVPLDDAKRVFELVSRCRSTSTGWIPRDTRRIVRVGDFEVDRIEPDGSFKAGCHTFVWSEIARVAQSIGLTV